MDIEEYREKIEEIEAKSRRDLEKLAREYATLHNKVKVGDMISDHICSICVEKISFCDRAVPYCIYKGCRLTKKGRPYKSGEKRWVHQADLIGV